MTSFSRIKKRIGTNGNSLSISVTPEARRMGLRAGDDVLVTLESCNGSRENRFHGVEVIELLLQGHVMRCDALNTRMAMDPMRVYTEKILSQDAIAMSPLEPTKQVPKDVWATGCPDVLMFAFSADWYIEDINVNELNKNTRAYHAIIRDAKKELGEDVTDPASINAMVHRLNDIGWDYDFKNDRGVYDRERL